MAEATSRTVLHNMAAGVYHKLSPEAAGEVAAAMAEAVPERCRRRYGCCCSAQQIQALLMRLQAAMAEANPEGAADMAAAMAEANPSSSSNSCRRYS